MQKYYNTLNKEEKRRIKDLYFKKYHNSDLETRLKRLKVYAIISYVFAIFVLISALILDDDLTGSIILSITMFILGTVYMFGSLIVKRNVLNKIALKNKKK